MARTKQTSKKSIAGKSTRKQLAIKSVKKPINLSGGKQARNFLNQ